MCDTVQACEEAERIVRGILEDELGLKLHPDKTRRVELTEGKEGFDFLGCHLHKRMSGRLWERYGRRRYFLQRWPSQTAMKRLRDFLIRRKGRHLRAGEADAWDRDFFWGLGLHRLRGTVRYPGAA